MKLFYKSPAVYKDMYDTKVLALPSIETLRKDRNKNTPCPGYTESTLTELKAYAETVKDTHRKITLLIIDEMTIKRKFMYQHNRALQIIHYFVVVYE